LLDAVRSVYTSQLAAIEYEDEEVSSRTRSTGVCEKESTCIGYCVSVICDEGAWDVSHGFLSSTAGSFS
jgi:hypothetical protein